jgi:hypothetical protein
MRITGKKIACGLTIIFIIAVAFIITWHLISQPLGKMRGEFPNTVTKKGLSEGAAILGVSFHESPTQLFYYSSGPDEYGGFEACLKANISQQEFLRIVKKMKLLPEKQWPKDSPLTVASRWTLSNDLDLMWWNPILVDENGKVYGLYLGQVGRCFAKYEKGSFYYHARVLKWF